MVAQFTVAYVRHSVSMDRVVGYLPIFPKTMCHVTIIKFHVKKKIKYLFPPVFEHVWIYRDAPQTTLLYVNSQMMCSNSLCSRLSISITQANE